MCVIIHKPAGIQLGKDSSDLLRILQDAAAMNRDGFGIQAWEGGKLVTNWKHATDQAKILEVAYANLDQVDLEVVAHWRLATHGEIIEANCHPFPINSKLSFFHNGVLSGFGSAIKGAEKSDTLDFVESVLRPQFGRWRSKPSDWHSKLLAKLAQGQRFAVTNHRGEVWRFGSWVEQDGVWYSNDWLLGDTYGYVKDWQRWDWRYGSWRDELDYLDAAAADYDEDLEDELEWDSELHEYVPVKSVRCECFGDICGGEHDLDFGCNRRSKYEVTLTGWKGDKYRSYSCAECAWLGGVEGVSAPVEEVEEVYNECLV